MVAYCDDLFLTTEKETSFSLLHQGPFYILAAINSMLIKVYCHTADAILFSKHIEFLYHFRQYFYMRLCVTLMLMKYDNILAENSGEQSTHYYYLNKTQHSEFCLITVSLLKFRYIYQQYSLKMLKHIYLWLKADLYS